MQPANVIFLVVLIGAFYFLLIRPQQQQAKRQQELVSSLAPGDEIMTVGGIYATIVEVAEDRVRVAVADGSELELAKRAVSSKLATTDTDGEDDAEEHDAESADTASAADTVDAPGAADTTDAGDAS